MIAHKLKHTIKDVLQTNSRICTITLKASGRNISFTSAYAPQSLRPLPEKEQFYRDLAKEIEQHKHEVPIILGDFNARLHYRAETEKPNIGTHLIGRGEEFALNAAEGTRQNRELFTQTLKGHNLYPLNTHFQLPTKRLVTYREMSTTDGGPPWDAIRYATIDYVLITERWKTPSRKCGRLRSLPTKSKTQMQTGFTKQGNEEKRKHEKPNPKHKEHFNE